jgi:hypothetical protein
LFLLFCLFGNKKKINEVLEKAAKSQKVRGNGSLQKRIVIVEEREREKRGKQHKLAAETSHVVKLKACLSKDFQKKFF